jgi:hypothetical protein
MYYVIERQYVDKITREVMTSSFFVVDENDETYSFEFGSEANASIDLYSMDYQIGKYETAETANKFRNEALLDWGNKTTQEKAQ